MQYAADASSAPVPRKREWSRAWRALRNLIDDPERTDQVFEIVRALSGNSLEHAYQRFAATADGRRLLSERPSLLATLSDRSALAALPEGSFGRAYAEFMDAGQLAADGLVEAEQMAEQSFAKEGPYDPDREYFGDRLRDMHDLWHVVAGYGRDLVGEASLLAFTFAQTWNPGVGFIVAVAYLRLGDAPGARELLREAFRRGRRAAWLPGEDWEALLARPLEEVRARLGLGTPPRYTAVRSAGSPTLAY